MRVLLVSANREHLPDPIFPLGLAYIAAAVRDAGHVIDVADLCFGLVVFYIVFDYIRYKTFTN